MAKLARKRREASGRRADRYAKIGREFESAMTDLLLKMREEKLITRFEAHAANTVEDGEGRDFTVAAVIGGIETERSFGVTISLKRWGASRILHPKVPQFCFPIGTKPETIRKRVLELFSKPPVD